LTDCRAITARHPTDESVGYYQPSASPTFAAKQQRKDDRKTKDGRSLFGIDRSSRFDYFLAAHVFIPGL